MDYGAEINYLLEARKTDMSVVKEIASFVGQLIVGYDTHSCEVALLIVLKSLLDQERKSHAAEV